MKYDDTKGMEYFLAMQTLLYGIDEIFNSLDVAYLTTSTELKRECLEKARKDILFRFEKICKDLEVPEKEMKSWIKEKQELFNLKGN